jgi:hypothetical protein
MPLFKYLLPKKGLRVLAECELMVTPPKYLNDPFEASPIIKCRDPDKYACQRIGEITSSPHFFESNRAHFPTVSTFEEFRGVLQKVSPLLLEQLVAGTPMVDSHIQGEAQQFISKNFGVICFSEDDVDQTMWAYYASHEGLVIEFRQEHQLFSGPSFFKIEYSDERVVFDPSNPAETDEARRFLKRKGVCWSSEREWRLLMNLEHATPHNVDEGLRYFLPIAAELIVSVTLGLRATDQTANTVVEILRAQHFQNVRVCKISKNSEAGIFERQPLKVIS